MPSPITAALAAYGKGAAQAYVTIGTVLRDIGPLNSEDLFKEVLEAAYNTRLESVEVRVEPHEKTIGVLEKAGIIADKEDAIEKLTHYFIDELEERRFPTKDAFYYALNMRLGDTVEEVDGVYRLIQEE